MHKDVSTLIAVSDAALTEISLAIADATDQEVDARRLRRALDDATGGSFGL